MSEHRGRPSWGWLVIPLLAVPVLLIATARATGLCGTGDPLTGSMFCTFDSVAGLITDPVVALLLWAAWAVLAWVCAQRALRPARRARRVRRVARDTAVRADGATPRVGAHTVVQIDPPAPHEVRMLYAPQRNGHPDGGEIVWAWVPYEDDPTRGKDRPLLILGRFDGPHLLALRMTTTVPRAPQFYLSLGPGPWDRSGRESWLDLTRVYRVPPAAMRREGAPLPEQAFDKVGTELARRYGWVSTRR